jgi:hypothetical protein
MTSLNGLDGILRQIRASGEKSLSLPPCPYCKRKLRANVGYYTRQGKKLASIALWCSACTAATTAFNVDPIPPWAAPTDSGAPAGGG